MSPQNRYALPPYTGRFDHLFANRRRVLLICLLVGLPFLIWKAVFGGPDWAALVVSAAAAVAAIRAVTPDERWKAPDKPE